MVNFNSTHMYIFYNFSTILKTYQAFKNLSLFLNCIYKGKNPHHQATSGFVSRKWFSDKQSLFKFSKRYDFTNFRIYERLKNGFTISNHLTLVASGGERKGLIMARH